MTAGRLNRLVEFQRLDSTSDEYGNTTSGTFSTLLTTKGQFSPMRADERLEGGRMASREFGTLKIRSSAAARGIRTDDRVLIGGTTYQIKGISNPDQRDRFLEITLEAGVAS